MQRLLATAFPGAAEGAAAPADGHPDPDYYPEQLRQGFVDWWKKDFAQKCPQAAETLHVDKAPSTLVLAVRHALLLPLGMLQLCARHCGRGVDL